jgi:ATP-dependent Lon protease
MDDKNIIYEVKKLEDLVKATSLPPELQEKCIALINRLNLVVRGGNYAGEFELTSRYIDWVISLPWNKASKDILDLAHAKQELDRTHFGLGDVKNKIYEYLSTMIIKSMRGATEVKLGHAPVLCLVGIVGTGKTTIAYSIANALGRKIERIPFGGMGGAALLRGQSRVFPDAEPGLIVKALRRAGTNNPVILLDEIDRIAQDSLSDIMGVLIELLDPEQNNRFNDHFIDYPFDLSNVLFIATANNTGHISTAVLDRLEILQMPSYTDDEKIAIGKQYMFPKILKDSGINENDVVIDDAVWPHIVRPLGYDPGIRTLQRTIQSVVRKVVRYMLEGKIRQNEKFVLNDQNINEFLPTM